MRLTSIALRSIVALLSLAAVRVARAEECVVRGVVSVRGGEPAPGGNVMIMRMSGFRGLMRQVSTGTDGTFAAAKLPCGKFMIQTAGAEPLTVDIAKQSTFQLTVPRSVVEGAAMMQEMAAAREAAVRRRALTTAETEDEREADAYRTRFLATAATPDDRWAYDQAPNVEGRKQASSMAVRRKLLP